MYKVFFNNIPVLIVGETTKGLKNYNSLKINYVSKNDFEFLFSDVPHHEAVVFLAKDPHVAWRDFISCFRQIEAAGGLVKKNDCPEYLFIFRHKKWDLPKGKLDEGETPEQCAMREIEEECGVLGLKIMDKLTETYHTYRLEGEPKMILKKTHWFLLNSPANGNELVGQLEEGITKVEWVHEDEIHKKTENTYKTIVEVLQKANLPVE